MRLNTAQDIRKALVELFPDVNDDDFTLEHSGFVHEHPEIAMAVVLISSIVLRTTDPMELAEFTRYSKSFVRCISN